MSKVKMCRFCCHLVPCDYWCVIRERCLSEDEISEERQCGSFKFNAIDAITLKRNYSSVVARLRRERRERALYEKRMRGDWS